MNTGVQRIVRNLHRALAALTDVTPLVWDPTLAAYCTLSKRERRFLEQPFAAGAAADAEPGRRANPVPLWSKFVRSLVHRHNRIDLAARLTRTDTLFIPEIFQDNRAGWLADLPARRVGVCHDALPWKRPEIMPAAGAAAAAPRRVGIFYDALTQRRLDLTPPTRQAGFAEYLRALGGFDHIVTISQESAEDLRACWREGGRDDGRMPPVTVFPWPVNHDGEARRIVPPTANGGKRPIVLCVGTFEPRKNHLLLLEAAERVWWEQGNEACELVLIGRTTAHWGTQVETATERARAAGRPVRWLRHVDDWTLNRAYEECAFTVFPSLAEGYGLPVLESLWHGRPCVCGGNGALGEVAAGGGCLVVDQTEAGALAAGIGRLLGDPEEYLRLCGEAAGRRFGTWQGLAKELLPVLRGG